MNKTFIRLLKKNKFIYVYLLSYIIAFSEIRKSTRSFYKKLKELINSLIEFFLVAFFIKKKTINLTKNKRFDNFYKKYFHHKSPELILDIGAHRGESILRFRELFAKSKIISFEPNPEAIKSIEEKISLFNFKNINYYQNAVGSENKIVNFFIYKKTDISSAISIDENSQFYKIRANQYSQNKNLLLNKIDVQQIKLDQFIIDKEIKNIDIIKIDVQGYEIEVLRGMSNLIKKGLFNFVEVEFMFKGPYKREEFSISNLEELLHPNYTIVVMNEIYKDHKHEGFVDILFQKKDTL